MLLTEKLLTELQRRLKIGNRRGVHLNAIPSNSRYKFDITKLAYIDKGLPNEFVDRLLTDLPLKFRISWKDNVPDLNTLFEEEQAQLTRITKAFENLINQTEAIESEKGINTFGFGFPILIRRDQLDNKLTVAPILIWSLRIKRTKDFNTWEIQRTEDDPIYINEVLLNHLQNDAKVKVSQIPSEMLEDGLIDKQELITLCTNLLESINSKVDQELGAVLAKKIESLIPIGDRSRYEELPISSTNALIEFGGLFSIFEVQKQNIINDYDSLLKLNGLDLKLEELSENSFQPISSVETDPSQQGILHGLEKESNILIQGPPGTGKSQTLTAILINALENHKKTIVVCEKRTALEVLHNALVQKGLQYYCVLIKDIVKDRKLVVDSVRERIDTSSYRRYSYKYSKDSLETLLNKITKIIKTINKKHSKLSEKVLGNREWSYVVGQFLRQTRKDTKIATLDLDKYLFDYSSEELNGIIELLETAEIIYAQFKPHESASFLNPEKLIGDNPYEIESKIIQDFEAYEKLLKRVESLENTYKTRYIDFRHSEWKKQLASIEEIQNHIIKICNKHQEQPDFLNEEKANRLGYILLSLFSKQKKVIREDQNQLKNLFNQLNEVCSLCKDIGPQTTPKSLSDRLVHLRNLTNKLQSKDLSFKDQTLQEYNELNLLNVKTSYHRFEPLEEIEECFYKLRSQLASHHWTKESPSTIDFKSFLAGLNHVIELKRKYFGDEGDLFMKEFKWFQFHNSLSEKEAQIVDSLKPYDNWKRTFLGYYLNLVLAKTSSAELPTDDKEHSQLKDSLKGVEAEQLRYIAQYWFSNQIDQSREFEKNQNGTLSVENLYNKKSSHRFKRLSLRQIVQYDKDLFTTFFPIVLTTPDVCCNLFGGMNHYFDLVMFDEASQLRLEDNLPAVLKGKQIVIAGDEHQMPPSNYFSKVFDGAVEDEDDLEEEETPNLNKEDMLLSCESLLDFATELNFNKRHLDFHYRSRHPYLIDFSNYAFYHRRLKPLPNDFDYSPINYIQIDGTFSEHTNEAEAEMVLAIIDENIQRFPNGEYPSVGVATFNIAQRNLIKSKILERQRFPKYQSFNEKILELEENGLFIKNLENIQGDERDVIIISTTYGLGKDGKFAQRFGPLSHSKGYKLLNVIITRAKYKIYICSSIPEPVFMNYKDYLMTDGNNRRGILYAYLAYCRAVSDSDDEARKSVLQALVETTSSSSNLLEHLGTLESPFEEEVYEALTEHFEKSALHIQFPYAGFKIDIVYRSNVVGTPKVAIECDGAKYHSSREAYLYDLHRQRILEAHGFVFHRIWSTNWWRNSKREITRLVEFITNVESTKEKVVQNPGISVAFKDDIPEISEVVKSNTAPASGKNLGAAMSDSGIRKSKDTGVSLNDKIKLKHVNNGKDVIIKISSTEGHGQKDGIQVISPNSPLGISILGKAIGDIVKVGNLDNFVEILQIIK